MPWKDGWLLLWRVCHVYGQHHYTHYWTQNVPLGMFSFSFSSLLCSRVRYTGASLESPSTGCFCPSGQFRAGNHSHICVSECPCEYKSHNRRATHRQKKVPIWIAFSRSEYNRSISILWGESSDRYGRGLLVTKTGSCCKPANDGSCCVNAAVEVDNIYSQKKQQSGEVIKGHHSTSWFVMWWSCAASVVPCTNRNPSAVTNLLSWQERNLFGPPLLWLTQYLSNHFAFFWEMPLFPNVVCGLL